MRKIVLSEKDLVAAKAILREAYENGGLRAARDAAKALVGVDGYVSVMVAAFQGEDFRPGGEPNELAMSHEQTVGNLGATKVAIRSAYAHGGIKAARETAQTLVGPVGYLSVMVAALRDQETNHDA